MRTTLLPQIDPPERRPRTHVRPILVLAAIGAHAQPGTPGRHAAELEKASAALWLLDRERTPRIFADGDTNDNVISGEEITNAASALKSLNKHQDGMLFEDELRPGFGRGRG